MIFILFSVHDENDDDDVDCKTLQWKKREGGGGRREGGGRGPTMASWRC